MAQAKEALKSLAEALARVGIKKPWEITGIASTPDYLHYLPKGTEYRRFSPGSQPVKAIIPHDVPQLVYDIKYFVRDYRRNSKYTMRTVDAKTPFDFGKMFGAAPLKPEEVKTTPQPLHDRNYGW